MKSADEVKSPETTLLSKQASRFLLRRRAQSTSAIEQQPQQQHNRNQTIKVLLKQNISVRTSTIQRHTNQTQNDRPYHPQRLRTYTEETSIVRNTNPEKHKSKLDRLENDKEDNKNNHNKMAFTKSNINSFASMSHLPQDDPTSSGREKQAYAVLPNTLILPPTIQEDVVATTDDPSNHILLNNNDYDDDASDVSSISNDSYRRYNRAIQQQQQLLQQQQQQQIWRNDNSPLPTEITIRKRSASANDIDQVMQKEKNLEQVIQKWCNPVPLPPPVHTDGLVSPEWKRPVAPRHHKPTTIITTTTTTTTTTNIPQPSPSPIKQLSNFSSSTKPSTTTNDTFTTSTPTTTTTTTTTTSAEQSSRNHKHRRLMSSSTTISQSSRPEDFDLLGNRPRRREIRGSASVFSFGSIVGQSNIMINNNTNNSNNSITSPTKTFPQQRRANQRWEQMVTNSSISGSSSQSTITTAIFEHPARTQLLLRKRGWRPNSRLGRFLRRKDKVELTRAKGCLT